MTCRIKYTSRDDHRNDLKNCVDTKNVAVSWFQLTLMVENQKLSSLLGAVYTFKVPLEFLLKLIE